MHVFQLNAEADYEVRPRFRTQRGSYNSGGRLDQRNTRTTGRANQLHRLEPMQLSFGLEQLGCILDAPAVLRNMCSQTCMDSLKQCTQRRAAGMVLPC